MEMSEIVEKAKEAFAEASKPAARSIGLPSVQQKLFKWQREQFGNTPLAHLALGVAEEVGELSHAILKRDQGIRGFDDKKKFEEAVADAIADTAIYSINLCSTLGIDYETVLTEVSKKILQRKWNAKKA